MKGASPSPEACSTCACAFSSEAKAPICSEKPPPEEAAGGAGGASAAELGGEPESVAARELGSEASAGGVEELAGSEGADDAAGAGEPVDGAADPASGAELDEAGGGGAGGEEELAGSEGADTAGGEPEGGVADTAGGAELGAVEVGLACAPVGTADGVGAGPAADAFCHGVGSRRAVAGLAWPLAAAARREAVPSSTSARRRLSTVGADSWRPSSQPAVKSNKPETTQMPASSRSVLREIRNRYTWRPSIAFTKPLDPPSRRSA